MMKRIYYILTIYLFIGYQGQTQCIKDISTNPDNPENEEYLNLVQVLDPNYSINPYLNSFNWAEIVGGSFNNIAIDLNANWDFSVTGNPSTYNMINPFDELMSSEYAYLYSVPAQDRDFRWEDGWELLWMNLGYFPNGDPIYNSPVGSPHQNNIYTPIPDNVPYFVLYNRYTGLMRIFANIWQDGSTNRPDKIKVVLKYIDDNSFNNQLSGILRHADNYDQPLDMETDNTRMSCVRFQAPSSSQWMVAEFQLAYDPCSCFSQGKFEIEFWWFDILDVKGNILGLSVDQNLTTLNFKDEDFFNIFSEEDVYSPGQKVYKSIDNLIDNYDNAMEKYNTDLKAYNDYENDVTRQILSISKDLIVGGVNTLVPGSAIATQILDEAMKINKNITEKEINSAITTGTKSILAKGFDFLSLSIYPKVTKPTKPQTPVGTINESVFKAEINEVNKYLSPSFYIPGTMPEGYGSSLPSITAFLYPAYNVTPGVFALLKKPEITIFENTTQSKIFESETSILTSVPSEIPEIYEHTVYNTLENTKIINFKLTSPLKYSYNDNLDIDYTKTKTLIGFRIHLKNKFISSDFVGFNNNFPDITITENSTNNSEEFLSYPFLNTSPQGNRADMYNIYFCGWYDIKDAAEAVYSIDLTSTTEFIEKELITIDQYGTFYSPMLNQWVEDDLDFEIEKIEMKILTDVFYDQIGYDEKQVNNSQVFTYLLYDKSEGIDIVDFNNSHVQNNDFALYTPGTLIIDDIVVFPTSDIVSEVVGNNIYIKHENINIIGNVTVVAGYNLFIQGLFIDVMPGATIHPFVTLESIRPYNLPTIELNNSEVVTFCDATQNGYMANEPVADALRSNEEEKPSENDKIEKDETTLKVYPSPASDFVNVVLSDSDFEYIFANIYTMKGELVLEEKLTNNRTKAFRIDVTDMKSGMYLLKINSSSGTTFTSKFIVK